MPHSRSQRALRRWGLTIPLVPLTVFAVERELDGRAPAAWPQRAIVTALHDRPVAFRAYPRGGILVVAVDGSGGPTTTPATIPTLRALTDKDTIRAHTPAGFPLDLSNGPVVFIADGDDSLNVVVGRNPNGSIDPVSARGRMLTVRIVDRNLVIDSR
jgi:hypothetical protein